MKSLLSRLLTKATESKQPEIFSNSENVDIVNAELSNQNQESDGDENWISNKKASTTSTAPAKGCIETDIIKVLPSQLVRYPIKISYKINQWTQFYQLSINLLIDYV